MFTGIVREVGRVVDVEGGDDGRTLHVEAPQTAEGVAVGDSVSVAGVCLTAESVSGTALRFHAVPETLARTSLARLGPGDPVNLEPALHAHVIPRYRDEPEKLRTQHPWAYDWTSAKIFDPMTAEPLMQTLRTELSRLGAVVDP